MLEAAAAAEPELDPEDLVHFSVGDLPSRGYGVMGEIRRQGKLCDVTLKTEWFEKMSCFGRKRGTPDPLLRFGGGPSTEE
uniref:Uncharacterized protein n=1 Tax=Strix occidentalis caurina TaxID=311401 RepID=A0A8D0KSZ9_STROC